MAYGKKGSKKSGKASYTPIGGPKSGSGGKAKAPAKAGAIKQGTAYQGYGDKTGL